MDDYKKFSRCIYLSTGIHLFMFLSMYFVPQIDFSILGLQLGINSEMKITKITSAVRVDIVSMPRRTLKELKVLEKMSTGTDAMFKHTEAPRKVVVKTKEVPSENDLVFEKRKKKKNFMSMLKNRSKQSINAKKERSKSKIKKQVHSGVKISNKHQRELRGLVLRGNQLSEGSRFTGRGEGAEATAFNVYVLSLPDHVRANWRLPSYLMNQDFKCRIRIYLSSTGKLIKANIYESSGNVEYDQKALYAVKKSTPFPVVPSEIKGRVVRGDVILGFPL